MELGTYSITIWHNIESVAFFFFFKITPPYLILYMLYNEKKLTPPIIGRGRTIKAIRAGTGFCTIMLFSIFTSTNN